MWKRWRGGREGEKGRKRRVGKGREERKLQVALE